MTLDFTQTLAFAGLVLFLGYGIKRAVPLLTRYNLPAPVIGGLIVSGLITAIRRPDWTPIVFDTALQPPLMIAFFTTVGFAASVSLLRVGGPQVLRFFLLSSVIALLQNVVGAGVARALGQHPLMGVLAGSVTLTGGPATGLAFAPEFAAAGLAGAATLAVASAMVGIVAGGIIGGPLGTALVERRKLRQALAPTGAFEPEVAAHVVEAAAGEPTPSAPAGEDVEAYGLLKTLVVILFAMWIGGWVSTWIQTNVRYPEFIYAVGGRPLILPAYIGAMLVAALIRNIDDLTGLFGLSQKVIDDLGSVALSLFLALALMSLKLWELAGLAVPLAIILAVQLAVVALVAAFVVVRVMGRDYEAAVMSSGFVGFMLGTTPNAMANMEAMVQRFGPAPRAFLVVPMVGAFFIDFANAILITLFLQFYR
ncbi:MAG: sodium/glutamate symporter [Vicinamibacteraceae bacterium]